MEPGDTDRISAAIVFGVFDASDSECHISGYLLPRGVIKEKATRQVH